MTEYDNRNEWGPPEGRFPAETPDNEQPDILETVAERVRTQPTDAWEAYIQQAEARRAEAFARQGEAGPYDAGQWRAGDPQPVTEAAEAVEPMQGGREEYFVQEPAGAAPDFVQLGEALLAEVPQTDAEETAEIQQNEEAAGFQQADTNQTAEQAYTEPVGARQAIDRSPYAPPPPYPPYAQPYVQPYTPPPYGQPYAPPPPYAPPYGQTPPPGPAYGQSPYSQFAQAQYGRQAEAPKQKKEKETKEKAPRATARGGLGRGNMAALVVIIIVACVASGLGGGWIGANLSKGEAVGLVDGGGPSITIEPTDSITTTEAVAKKVLASVVGITSTGRYLTNNYFFGESESEVSGVGTGMIIDARGYILTNSHVVMDGTVDTIQVLLSDGDEVEGKLIWNDKDLDLAIVKIESSGLQPVELGDSDEVAIGSYVAAIGNPLGLQFSGSITQGVVSGLNRTIEVSDGMGGATSTMWDLIQVDAAINSGNSGGPLLNSRGQVIGVNTAKASAEGMGFAIPINTAIPIVEKVIRDGSFERVFMGVSAADVDSVEENFPNVILKAEKGACIMDVTPGSPAEKGGLRVKDVIIAIDGNEVDGSNSLIKLLLAYESGDKVTVTYNRDGVVEETEVTLISQSELDVVQQEENPFRTPDRGNSGR